jgi:hypothetical protein
MSATLQIGDIVRARLVTMCADQLGECILHYSVVGPGPTTATDADMASALDSALFADVLLCLAADTTYRGFGVQIINRLRLLTEQVGNSNAGIGTASVHSGSKQSAALCTWRSAFAGRSGRGRSYFPFIPSPFYTTSGELTAGIGGAVPAYQSLADGIRGFTLVSVGGRTAHVEFDILTKVGMVLTKIVSGTVSARPATQRRRGDFGRPNVAPF